MALIRLYPSTLPGAPIREQQVTGMTLDAWLRESSPSYRRYDRDHHPLIAAVNDRLVPPAQWDEVWLGADTTVELRPQPAGGPELIAAVVAAVVSAAAALMLTPSLPSQRNSSTKGSKLLEVSAEGNQVRLGDLIPDIAGRVKANPDYIAATRRYFIEPKKQALDMLLCVGLGEHDIQPDDIKIGATPVTSLGTSVDLSVFGPGEDVTGHVAHQNWYNAPEVGPSTSGSGLRLKSSRDLQKTWTGTHTFDGTSITTPEGPPDSWAVGTQLTIELPIDFDVTGGGSEPNVFHGPFAHFEPEVGAIIYIHQPGDESGTGLRVTSYTAGSPDQMTLEDGLTNEPISDWSPGSYNRVIRRPNYADPRALHVIESIDSDGVTVRYEIDGTPVSNWAGFPVVTTGSALVEVDDQEYTGIWSSIFLACPEGETTDTLEFDLYAPQGLGHIDGSDVDRVQRTIEFRYREQGTTTWTTVSRTVEGATRDQLGWTFRESIPAMTPEVQMRRVSAESNATDDMDRLEWYGLRSRHPHATSYPGVTVIALTITGSDTIASQTENQVAAWVTRKLPLRENGAWTAPQPTRSPAAYAMHVAKAVGYTDDKLHLSEFERLADLWESRGDTYNAMHRDDSTVKEVINAALRVGFAELTIDRGRIRPVRDEPRGNLPLHGYSAQTMIGSLGRQTSMPKPDDNDGIDVTYIDEGTWTEATVPCRLQGDQGIRTKKVKFDAAMTRTQAWRLGMRERARLEYRRTRFQFQTELAGLNSSYMSRCAIATDVPGYGQSAWVKVARLDELAGTVTLEVSEEFDWVDGASHVIAWREPNGKLTSPFPAQPGATPFEVVATTTQMPTVRDDMEPPFVHFGTTENWSWQALVREVSPEGNKVSISAVIDDPRVYEHDDATPPA
ncbi:host specificity factor TipJ family phage tail protein [Halomonas caseinilytica]|nr:host specificity factor TipJ family phage tail protein [Halomonas caseinilytica]